jgi:hypothetical protein
MTRESWQYDGGVFVHTGQSSPKSAEQAVWHEFQPSEDVPRQIYFFTEIFRDQSWIFLFDEHRRLWAALSTNGGECYLQWWLPQGGIPQYPWQLQYNNGLMCNLAHYPGPIPPPSGGL